MQAAGARLFPSSVQYGLVCEETVDLVELTQADVGRDAIPGTMKLLCVKLPLNRMPCEPE